jgi:hypothetical protein
VPKLAGPAIARASGTDIPYDMRKKRALVVSPAPSAKRLAKLRKIVEQAHRKYGEVFKRLAD